MRRKMSIVMLAAVVGIAGCVSTGADQGRVAHAGMSPQVRAPVFDPLDRPVPPGCAIASDTIYATLGEADIKGARQLVRVSSKPTHIRALAPGSQQWITRCPVKLVAAPHSSYCAPLSIINPDGRGSFLQVVNGGSGIVFEIKNTSLGTIRGQLKEVANPHDTREVTWLKSSNVTSDSGPPNRYDFYVYLQEKDGLKSYLVEIFDQSDHGCLDKHLPGPSTLCLDEDDGSSCLMSADGMSVTAEGAAERVVAPTTAVAANNEQQQSEKQAVADGYGYTQGDTGAGHEPIERVY